MYSNVGWIFDASIHVTHYKLLGKHMWEKTTFVYRICNSGFKKISKETIKKLDKEFKSIKNSSFANPLSCHTKPIHVQPSTFCCMRLWTLHSKSSEIFMNPCNFLPLECCWKLATIFLLWKLQGSTSLICLLCTKVKEENVPSVAWIREKFQLKLF